MRATLSFLALAAVIAVGLWYLQERPESPVATPSEAAAPTDGDLTETVDSRTADTSTVAAADPGRSIDPGAASPAGADQTEDSGAVPRTGTPEAADSDTTSPAESAQTTDSGPAAEVARARTGETGAGSEADSARPADSGATGDGSRIAAAKPADQSGTSEAVPSPAPESTVERVPIDAPAEDATGQTDVLAAVEGVIEQVETAIRERFVTEPETNPDTPGAAAQIGTGQVDAADTVGAAAPGAGSAQTAGSEATSSTNASQTAHTDAAPSPDVTATDATEAEAKRYVERLTATAPETIPVDKASHFVTREHVLSLVPEDTIESVSVAELAEDDTLQPETSITVVREVEQVETAVPEQLIAEAGGNLDTKLRFVVEYDDAEIDAEQNVATQDDPGRAEGGQDLTAQGGATENADVQAAIEEITVREVLERIRSEPRTPISVIRTVRYFEVMTLRELLDAEQGADTFLNVVTQPYRIEAATLADLLQRERAGNPGTIFYLHTVQPTDEQGIWGIIHSGLIDNFSRGVALDRAETIETYKVDIPRDADERLHDQSSSFLGKLIDRKTKESFVYNYRDNRIGHNPDRIYPGQEIVIINFELEELTSIYTHFAGG